MFAKLESLERKFLDLEQELADPTVFNDQDRYRKPTRISSPWWTFSASTAN